MKVVSPGSGQRGVLSSDTIEQLLDEYYDLRGWDKVISFKDILENRVKGRKSPLDITYSEKHTIFF